MVNLTSIGAAVTSFVALVGVYFSYRKAEDAERRFKLEKEKLQAQYDQEKEKLQAQYFQIKAQFGEELSAERAALNLLECTPWKRRTFKALKYHLGGYDDDELRKLLIRAGALRFTDDQETWGLLTRNQSELEEERFTKYY